MSRNVTVVLVFFLSVLVPPDLCAQDGGQMPPAKVVVSEVELGHVAPQSEFVGTAYFPEVSDTASEVSGRVEQVSFEEGDRVKAGDPLVRLNADLLEKTLEANVASYEEVLSDLEKARADLERVEGPFRQDLIAEQAYDEYRFRVKGLERKAASFQAEVERLRTELTKKTITAPFDGVVLRRPVDRGEWLSPGVVVATIAKDDMVDVVVDVPQEVARLLTPGFAVQVNVGGQEAPGEVLAVIPRGDVSTRTFPVKVRVRNVHSFMEGMEARVTLPIGEAREAVLVPRDAVITLYGQTVAFAVENSTARMITVQVMGYQGAAAGVHADGLKAGMKVVIKGHERLRDGQAVSVTAQEE